MVTFEITIQRKSTVGWPVVVEQSAPGQFLPIRIEGLLQLDLEILQAPSTPLDYDRILGQALFAGPVRNAFVQAPAASGNALWVLLCVEDDGLKTLHWQRLCGSLDGGWSFLSLQQRTLFSPYLTAVTDRRFPAIGRLDPRVSWPSAIRSCMWSAKARPTLATGRPACFSPPPAAGWIASTARGSCSVLASWTRLPPCRTWSFWLPAPGHPARPPRWVAWRRAWCVSWARPR